MNYKMAGKRNNTRISMVVPVRADYGWGVCGQYLVREMVKLCDVSLVTHEFTERDVGDSKVFQDLKSLCSKDMHGYAVCENTSVLQTIGSHDLRPWFKMGLGHSRIGYTFFERNVLDHSDVNRAKDEYDIIVAGSTWCEEILKTHGFKNTSTIRQGVDPELFNPCGEKQDRYRDFFVVFSGGKLELRKGQDLVLAAFRVLQDKYPDMLLVNAWYNPWSASLNTMGRSPYIDFRMPPGDYFKAVNRLLAANEIDLKRVVTLPPIPHRDLSEIYRNTDIGLFPNRCEGGTNLVLMEYMACGKPTIASYSSGHRDILTETNAVCLKNLHPVIIRNQQGNMLYEWEEPTVEEIVACLEWAYAHRKEIERIGKVAAEDMSKMTWGETARGFYELFN